MTLAAQLAALEGAESALALSSGMAAISSTLVHLLEPGAHVIIVKGPYGGTHDLVHALLKRWGVAASSVDADDGPEVWGKLLQPGKTKVFYVEAISNPLTKVGIGKVCWQGALAGRCDSAV